MDEKQTETVKKAIKILRDNGPEEKRAVRNEYAAQMELHLLIGPAENDETCVWLAETIIKAEQKANRDFSHLIGSPLRVSDVEGDNAAAYFCDPRTPAQIEADELDRETRETHESARP